MNKTLKYGLLGGIGALVGIGAFWLKNQVDLLTETCFKMGKVKAIKLGLTETVLGISVMLKNLSKVKLRINKQVYNVYLNDVFVSQIVSENAIELTSNEEKVLDLTSTFNPKAVLKNATGDIIFGFNELTLKVKMELTFDLKYINWTIKYTYQDKVKNLITEFSKPKEEGVTNEKC